MPRRGFGMYGMGMMPRRGVPIIGAGRMMGGGMGMRMGSRLVAALLTGGLGYLAGRRAGQRQQSAQQTARIGEQQQPASYPSPQAAPAPQIPAATVAADTSAQLKLLGQLHESGVLTDTEFEAEKQKVLSG